MPHSTSGTTRLVPAICRPQEEELLPGLQSANVNKLVCVIDIKL